MKFKLLAFRNEIDPVCFSTQQNILWWQRKLVQKGVNHRKCSEITHEIGHSRHPLQLYALSTIKRLDELIKAV